MNTQLDQKEFAKEKFLEAVYVATKSGIIKDDLMLKIINLILEEKIKYEQK